MSRFSGGSGGRLVSGIFVTLMSGCILIGCSSTNTAASTSPTSTQPRTTSPGSAPATWTSRPTPAGVGYLNDVTCPTKEQCYAVGGDGGSSISGWIIGSSDGGDTWKTLATIPNQTFMGIACPTSTRCIAYNENYREQGGAPPMAEPGNTPLAVETDDGGQGWSTVNIPAEVKGLSGISCATATVCTAVGYINGYIPLRTTDGGSNWIVEPPVTGLTAIDTVTCPTASFCIIGGSGSGREPTSLSVSSVSHDGGLNWSPPVSAGGFSGLGQISCVDERTCVGILGSDATNSYGWGVPIATSDGGDLWTDPSGISVASKVGNSVSCVGDACVSVGGVWLRQGGYLGDSFLSTDNGRSWSSMKISTPNALDSVDCPLPTECVAVGGNAEYTIGVIMTYGT